MAGLCPCHASGWSRASGGSALPHPWLFLHKSAEVFLLTCIPVCCSERGSDGQHGCRNCYVISLQYKLQRKHAPHTILWCCISQNILVEEGYFFVVVYSGVDVPSSQCQLCPTITIMWHRVAQIKTAFSVTITGQEVRGRGWRWCDGSTTTALHRVWSSFELVALSCLFCCLESMFGLHKWAGRWTAYGP